MQILKLKEIFAMQISEKAEVFNKWKFLNNIQIHILAGKIKDRVFQSKNPKYLIYIWRNVQLYQHLQKMIKQDSNLCLQYLTEKLKIVISTDNW